jgi:hypothetical protein
MEHIRYGERGEGSLYRKPSGIWYSVLSVAGKQREFSTKQTDLRLAKRFHWAKLDGAPDRRHVDEGH